MTKEKLEDKIKELETACENAKANLYAIQGALHTNKQWLSELPVEKKKNEDKR